MPPNPFPNPVRVEPRGPFPAHLAERPARVLTRAQARRLARARLALWRRDHV